MEVRPGYKQTEVGMIPEDWEALPARDIGVFKGGSGFPLTAQGETSGAYPFFKVSDMNNEGNETFMTTANHYISEQTRKRLGATAFPADSIVFAKVGAAVFLERKKILGQPSCIDNNMAAFILDSDRVDVRYVHSLLLSKKLGALVATTALPALNGKQLGEMTLAVPPLAVQRAIATALSDVDALLSGLDRLIAKKRDLKQASMQQLLTGQTRLKGCGPTKGFKQYDYGIIPDDWSVRPFNKVSSMNGRIGWQGLKQDEFTENPDDPFLITGMNFKDGRIRWGEVYHIPTKRYQEAPDIQLQVGDVLATKDGTIGKLLFVDHIPNPGKASLNSHLLVFRPLNQQYDPKFLFYQLGSPAFVRHIELHKSGSTFFGLTQAATGKYPVVIPSLPEQTTIAAALSDMDAELAALEARRDKIHALKQGMMQELLTGRTRLL